MPVYQAIKHYVTGRLCLGFDDHGCDVSLDGMQGRKVRCDDCALERNRILCKEKQKERRSVARSLEPDRLLTSRPFPNLRSDPERVAVRRCSTCAGMPDARSNDRAPLTVWGKMAYPVMKRGPYANGFDVCIECELPWGPEEPIEKPSGWGQSSAYTTRSAALYYGAADKVLTTNVSKRRAGL